MRNLLLLLVLLSACSPVRRIERICQRHPEVCGRDTLRLVDTVLVPSVRIDTAFRIVEGKTITVEKERAVVRVKVRRDTLYVDAECKADTIIRTHNIVRDKVVIKEVEEKMAWWMKLLAACGILFILYIVFRVVKA